MTNSNTTPTLSSLSTLTLITVATCGYAHLPTLAASDVWSVDAAMKSVLAPCEVWEEKGAYYFRTFRGEVCGPFESEMLACQCAAIVRNPSLQFAPKPAKSFDWRTHALQCAVKAVVREEGW